MSLSLVDHIKQHLALGVLDEGGVDSKIAEYLSTFEYQEPVLDRTNVIPAAPDYEARYLVTSVASGDWTGYEEQIAEYSASGVSPGTWSFSEPDEGTLTWVEDEDQFYLYNDEWPAGSWVKLPTVLDHGTLAGLSDDDHSQYLLLAGRTDQEVSGTSLSLDVALFHKSISIDDTDSPYSLQTDDYLLFVDSSTASVVVDLPTAQCLAGRTIVIKDSGGSASVNNITVTTEGAEDIEFASTLTLNADGAAVTITANSSNWFIV